MITPGRAGTAGSGRGAPPQQGPRRYGNYPEAGIPDRLAVPAPSPSTQDSTDGQPGGADPGSLGADPRAPSVSPFPRRWAWGEGGIGLDDAHQSFRRFGIQGFNDQLTVKDRHAYWDPGNQKTGTDHPGSGGGGNAYNDPLNQPPAPELRLTNRTVSYQKGSDKTRHQDDLSRGYTWLGEQGSGWAPVYGGVPGLYQPYGSRGGYPYPVQSPAEFGQPGDGPRLVWSGPPHGLHSATPWKGGEQVTSRIYVMPQQRPVRQDRPSESPQAGQSYSQTVLPQGATGPRPGSVPVQQWWGGRGWAGRSERGGTR